jgi:hypothetical protein
VIADEDSWFTYYFWLDDAKAPDYARCVDIHRKPGYDPVELVLDPKIKFPMVTVGSKVLKKKLGFRYLMDVIPLDASLVKGSHGCIPPNACDYPVFITQKAENSEEKSLLSTQITQLILEQIFGKQAETIIEKQGMLNQQFDHASSFT